MKKYEFQEPKDIYRGLDLWMVNDELTNEEVAHQVEEFKAKGLSSVIFRTYNGLISDYPGPKFKERLRTAINTAKKCGLKITLQAGYMPSAFPELPKEFALHRITPIPEEKLTDGDVVLARYDGIAYTDKIAAATVNMLDECSTDYYIKTAYENMWEEFRGDFGDTVVSVWVDEPRFDNRYLTWTPTIDEEFTKEYGYSLKENIPALYHDIGDFKKVRYDYFTLLRSTMEKRYYSKVREWCHSNGLSFSGHLMGEERLSMQITQAVAVMPFYKYFDVPGIDMLRADHDWYDKPLRAFGKYNQGFVERSMHVSAVQCVSAAEQAGKEHVLCEMYGVTTPNFVFRDQMHLFDFFAANGINHQCMHALFYSPRGFRKRFYPQTFNVYQPFWENFRNIKDYVARVSNFISMGKTEKDVLVLHPLETAYGLCRGLTNPTDESNRDIVEDYDKKYYRFIIGLYSSQIPFHFGDMATIDEMGSVSGKKFVVGDVKYNTVILSDIEVLSAKTLALLKEFAENGGRILIKGKLPERVDGAVSPLAKDILSTAENLQTFENNECLLRELRKQNSKDFIYRAEDDISTTVINHRKDGEKNYFFIHNGDCRREKRGELIINGLHKAYLFNGENSSISELYVTQEDGKTKVPFINAIGGSVMIFTEPSEISIAGDRKDTPQNLLPISNLSAEIQGENLLTLELCTYKTEKMQSFYDKEMSIERVVEKLKREKYEGEVTLKFSFYSEFEAKNLKLVLEDAEECKISLNGIAQDMTVCGYYYSKAFNIINLSDDVKAGENVIELTRYTKPQIAETVSDDMKHLFELFRAPVGVDLERVHILGDFRVECIPEIPTGAGIVRVGKRFFMTPSEKTRAVSDFTSHGYPFYPGTIDYKSTVTLGEIAEKSNDILLSVGIFNGCSSAVFVNGKKIGSIDREPYSISIKDAITSGTNEITIRLYGTMRNMIGPSHTEGTDPVGCNRTTWYQDYERSECTEYDISTLTNSFQLAPYGIGDVKLIFC